jgi:hypothetical protein
MDFRLLELLPEVGLIGGVHWRGRRVRDLRDELNQIEGIDLSSGNVQARLQAMRGAGFVRDFATSGHGKLWAKTPEGVEHYESNNIEQEEADESH